MFMSIQLALLMTMLHCRLLRALGGLAYRLDLLLPMCPSNNNTAAPK